MTTHRLTLHQETLHAGRLLERVLVLAVAALAGATLGLWLFTQATHLGNALGERLHAIAVAGR